MRLRTYVAMEAVSWLATLAGVTWAILLAAGTIEAPWQAQPADRLASATATSVDARPLALVTRVGTQVRDQLAATSLALANTRVPAQELPHTPELVAAPATRGVFAAGQDEERLAPLRAGEVARFKTNSGGSSLSLRIEFIGGARAAFKPEQIHGQSSPRREIAAYRLDRLLGIGRVPPAVGREFSLEDLLTKAESDAARQRVRSEALPRQQQLRGELSWWISELKEATLDGNPIDETEGILAWRRELAANSDWAALPEARRAYLAQISDMTLFDFVTGNADRWTGGNVKSNPAGTELYFMDNTMSFTSDAGTNRTLGYLARVERFSASLVARLRTLTAEEIAAAVADAGPFDYLLTQEELAYVLRRRDAALRYIDELVARHGQDKVLALP